MNFNDEDSCRVCVPEQRSFFLLLQRIFFFYRHFNEWLKSCYSTEKCLHQRTKWGRNSKISTSEAWNIELKHQSHDFLSADVHQTPVFTKSFAGLFHQKWLPASLWTLCSRRQQQRLGLRVRRGRKQLFQQLRLGGFRCDCWDQEEESSPRPAARGAVVQRPRTGESVRGRTACSLCSPLKELWGGLKTFSHGAASSCEPQQHHLPRIHSWAATWS